MDYANVDALAAVVRAGPEKLRADIRRACVNTWRGQRLAPDMTRRVLVVACLSCCALCASRPPAEVDLPKGIERYDYCSTCLHMVNDFERRLLPALKAAAGRKNAAHGKYQKLLSFGEVDELIEQHVEEACRDLQIWNTQMFRKSCQHIVETAGETFTNRLARWFKAGRPTSELRSMLCSAAVQACRTTELNQIPRPGDKVKSNKTSWMSEHPPEGPNDGPVFQMVGATLNGTVNNASGRDTILYVYHQDERHDLIRPKFHRLAELLWALPRRPPTLFFAEINAASNELIPPWNVLVSTTIILLPGGRPPIPALSVGTYEGGYSVLEWLEPVERSLGELIEALVPRLKERKSQEHFGNLMNVLGNDAIHGSIGMGKWWLDDSLLVRAREDVNLTKKRLDEQGLAKEDQQRRAAKKAVRREAEKAKAKRDELRL